MCIVSMVHDHFGPKFPDPERTWPGFPPLPDAVPKPSPFIPGPFVLPDMAKAVAELRQLIADFREAVEAAKKVDALTGQPDCLDPSKQKLEERVTALEKALAGLKKPKRRGKP